MFGKEDGERIRIANMLNYKLGELPMKYLGMPISGTTLGMSALEKVAEKISRRMPPWKGKTCHRGEARSFK
jgi:hypothetical protein